MAELLAVVTFASTAGGGLFALHHQDRLHLILGFAAGVMLGVVAFDLLPEIADFSGQAGGGIKAAMSQAMLPMLGGFLVLHILEKTVLMHPPHDVRSGHGRATDLPPYADAHHPRRGVVSALALCTHSFTDGIGIGIAFQAGTGVGVTVALAVIAHDFADGLNTVSLMMVNHNSRRRSLLLLGVDAIAPMLGAASTLFFTLPDSTLRLYLGFFAGVLLYLATGDILPEAHARHPSRLTMVSTVVGVIAMYLVTRVAL